jgi:hypothetical protein
VFSVDAGLWRRFGVAPAMRVAGTDRAHKGEETCGKTAVPAAMHRSRTAQGTYDNSQTCFAEPIIHWIPLENAVFPGKFIGCGVSCAFDDCKRNPTKSPRSGPERGPEQLP